MGTPNEEQGKATNAGLKSQLEDIQRRIDHETEEALSKRASKRRAPFSKILSQRDKRTSMPVFAGSSTHNNVANSTSSKDVNFVVGLSENLLLECRRLQADNENKASSLRSLQQDYLALKATFEKLSRRLHGTEKESSALKDSNWELETKLQQMSQQLKLLRDASERSQKELRAQLDAYNVTRSELDELSLDRKGLKNELESVHQNYMKEIADLKQNVSDLNEENDELQRKLDSMNTQILQLREDMSSSTSPALSSAGANAEPVTLASNIRTNANENARGSGVDSSSQNSVGDLETANKVIETLRKQILKLKSARSNTSVNKDGTHDQEPSILSSSPVPLTDTPASIKHVTPTKSIKHRKNKSNERRHSIQSSDDFNFSISSECIRAQNDTDDEDLESDVSETLDIVRNPILDELDTNIYELDPEEFKRYAEKNNLVVLRQNEFDVMNGLHKDAGNSNQNDIIKELKDRGYKVFEQNEYETLCESLTSQKSSCHELESLAASVDKKLISQDEYASLKNPPLPWLLDQVNAAGYAAIKASEYQAVRNRAENPCLETLKSGLQKHGLVPIEEELFQKLNHPTLDSISMHAKAIGYEMVELKSWTSFQEIAHNPSLSFLSDSAKEKGQVIIPIEEHEALRHPSLGAITSQASEYGYATVPKEDFEKIKSFDIQWVREQASDRNLVIISKREYETLQHPSLDELKKISSALDNVLVPRGIYEEFSNPSVPKLKELAATKDCEVVSSGELRQLKKCLESPEEKQVRLGAKQLNLTVLSNRKYQSMQDELKNPKFDVIKKCIEASTMNDFVDWLSREFNSVLIKKEEHEKLIDSSREPTLEHLINKASDKGYCVIAQKELSELKRRLAYDDLDILNSKCLELGKTLVDKKSYDKLCEENQHPSIDYLRQSAESINYEVIHADKLSSMTMKLTSPPFAFLEEKVKKMGYVPIQQVEYSALKKKIEYPDQEYMKEKAYELGYCLVTLEHYQAINENLLQPTIPYLEEKAGKLDFVLVQKKDHEILKTDHETLKTDYETLKIDHETLQKDHNTLQKDYEALKKDHETLEVDHDSLKTVHETMQQVMEVPDASYLEQKAGKLDFVLVPKKDHETLKEDHETLKKDHGTLKTDHDTLKKGHETLKEDHETLKTYHGTLKEDNETLEKDYETLKKDHKTLKTDHDTLKTNHATLEEDNETLKKDHETLKMDHETLKKAVEAPDALYLEQKAGQLDFVLIPKKDHETLKTDHDSLKTNHSTLKEDNETLKEDHKALKKEYETLKKAVEAPDALYLEQKAGQLDFVLVPKKDHETLKEDHEILKENHETLKKGHGTLKTDHDTLKTNHGTLKEDNETLEKDYETLKKDNKTLKTDHDSLKTNHSTLKEDNETLKEDHKALKKEYETLKKAVEAPDALYLEQKAGQLDFVLVPKKDHETLKEDHEILKENHETLKKGHGTLKTDHDTLKADHYALKEDHANLQKAVEAPDASYLEQKAGQLDFVLVPKKDYNVMEKTLETPDVSYLKEKASLLGCVVVSSKDQETMKKTIETPDASYLAAKAGLLGCIIIPKNDHRAMKKTVETPDIAYLESKADLFGCVMVSKRDNNILKKTVESPDASYLEEKAAQLGLVLVPKKDHETLMEDHETLKRGHETLKTEHDTLKTDHGTLKTVHDALKTVHETMQKAVEAPDASYLEQKAGKLDFVLVPKKDHETLKEDHEILKEDHETLKKVRETLKTDHDTLKTDHDTLKTDHETLKEEHETLKKTVDSPDASYLEQKAGKLDFVLVPKKDHETLKEDHETLKKGHDSLKTDHDTLKTNHETLKEDHYSLKEDHATLQKAVEAPDVGYLKEKAEMLGFTLLAATELQKLQEALIKPALSYLKEKAEDLKFTVISKEEYNKMIDKFESPDFDYLESKALGYKLIPLQEYERFKDLGNTAAIDIHKRKCEDAGYTVTEKKHYESLIQKANNPSVQELSAMAAKNSRVLLAIDEFEKMKQTVDNPPKDYLLGCLEAHGLCAISQQDYDTLTAASGNDAAFKKVRELGYKVFTLDELAKLETEIIENAKIVDIEQRLKSEDMAIISAADLKEFNKPLVDKINSETVSSYCKENDLLVVSIAEYDELKNAVASLTPGELQKLADNFGSTLVPATDYKELHEKANSPSLQFLKQEALKAGMLLITKVSYEREQKELHHPQLEVLNKHANEIGKVIVDKEVYENLKELSDSPSLEFLEEKSKELGYCFLANTEYLLLQETIQKPSEDYLKSKAVALDRVLVDTSEYEDLKKRDCSPSSDDLEAKANSIGMKLLSDTDYKVFEIIRSPSIQYLLSKSHEHGYTVIKNEEYEALLSVKERMSIDEISTIAAKHAYTLVSAGELKNLQGELDSPSEDFLLEKSRMIGKVLVEKSDYDSDRKTLDLVENPTSDFVCTLGLLVDYVALPSAQYKKMEDSLQNPPIGPLTSYLEDKGFKLLPQQEYADLVSFMQPPDISFLENTAKKFERVLIPASDHRELLKTRDDPSLDFLLNKIKNHSEYVTLEKAKFDLYEKNNTNPPLEFLEINATSRGKVLVDYKDWELFEQVKEKPNNGALKKQASKNNKGLVNKAKYEDFKDSPEPSFDILERNIKASGQTLLSDEDFETLNHPSKTPSIDLIERTLESLGLIALTKAKYDQLTTMADYPDLKKVRQIAQSRGEIIVTLPQNIMPKETNSTEPQTNAHEFLVLTYEEEVPKLSNFIDLPDNLLANFCQKFSLLPVTKIEYNLVAPKLSPPDLKQLVSSSLSNSENANKQTVTSQRSGVLSGTLQKTLNSMGFCIIDFPHDVSDIKEELRAVNEGTGHELNRPFSGQPVEGDCKRSSIDIESQSPKSPSANSRALQDLGNPSNSLPVRGVVVLNPEDYKLLLSSSNNGVINVTLDGDSITSENEIERKQVKASFRPRNNPALSFEELEQAAMSCGYQLVSPRTLDSDQETWDVRQRRESLVHSSSQTSLPSVANSRFSYRSSGCASTNESEYYDAQQSLAEPLSFDNSSGSLSVEPSEYEDALDQTFSEDGEPLSRTSTMREGYLSQGLSLSEVSELAKALGYKLIKEEDNAVHTRSFSGTSEPSGNVTIPSLSEGSVSDSRSKQEDFENKSNYSISDDALRAQAASYGMVIITYDEFAEYKSLKKAKDELNRQLGASDFVLRSAPTGECDVNFDCDNRVIVEQKTTDGNTDHDFTNEKSNLQHLIDAASLLGFKLVQENAISASEGVSAETGKSEDDVQSPIESRPRRASATGFHPSKEELVERAHEYGLVALEAEHFAQIKEELAGGTRKMTLDDIMIKSAEFGLVPIQRAQFEQIKEELSNPTLTKDQVIASAKDFGLVAVDKEELKRLSHFSDSRATDTEDDDLTSSGIGGSEATNNSEDRREVYNLAKKLGLMCIPENKFVVTTTASVIDTNNVVVLPSSYYENLLAKEQEALKMTTNDELQAEAKRRGLHMGFKSPAHGGLMTSPFGQAKISRQNTIKSTGSSESNSRRSLAEAAAAAAYSDYEIFNTKTREHSRSASTLKPTALGMDVDVPHIRHTSFDGGISLATVASLSEPSIIPALTQTVIGEYLHKYYRRLGAFSQISSRHERYFWVHPYTMTLYWSTNNPVLENPASNKTRAAAILGIESVEDSNPYPAGLYHKSILITTESRPIKITCATRQRHNIWFNSLRYLLQRNMDGINLDDTATDPNDANKIYQLPGETAKLTNQRLSSTRRLTSSGSANRSSSTRTLRR